MKPKVIVFNYFINDKYNFTSNIMDWYNSMKENYLVDCDRQFVVYTDNKRAAAVLSSPDIKFYMVDPSEVKNPGENKLRKFKYIRQYIDREKPEFDYFCFIQSNSRCTEQTTLSEMTDGSHELVVCRHCDNNHATFKDLYYNKPGSVVDISRMYTLNFIYAYSGHFLAKRDMLLGICDYVNSKIDEDRKNPDFPKWYPQKPQVGTKPPVYDETYFNYYLNTVLMKRDAGKVKVLDGNVYCHAFYSHERKFKMTMLNKQKMKKGGLKITPQELMKHSFVISIDKTRLDLFNRLFTAHNLLPIPQTFNGVCDKANKPVINCYLSHRGVIQKAKELDWPYVCIFEDDAYPINRICDRLDSFLQNIPDECGVLILGNSGVRFNANYNWYLDNKVGCYGSHAYIVFKDWYDKYLKFLDDVKFADAFQFNRDNIMSKNHFFMTKLNLFIQFCDRKSMNGHCGYIWRVEGKKLSNAEIFMRGYLPIESYIDHSPTISEVEKKAIANRPKPRKGVKKFINFMFG